MVDIKRLLNELNLEELQNLKNNPSIIDEVIAEHKYGQSDTLLMASGYSLEGTKAKVFIPKYKIIDDKKLAKQLLSQNGLFFEQLSEQLKGDEELINIAFHQNPYVLYNLPEEMVRKVVNKSSEEVKHILTEGGSSEEIFAKLNNVETVKSAEELKGNVSNWLNSDSVKNAQVDLSRPAFQVDEDTYYRTNAEPITMEFSLSEEENRQLHIEQNKRNMEIKKFFEEGLKAGKTLDQIRDEYLSQSDDLNGPHR